MSLTRVMSKISMHSAKNFPKDFFKYNHKSMASGSQVSVDEYTEHTTENDEMFNDRDSISRNKPLQPLIKKKS